MKKKNFFAPSQMIILSGTIGENDGGSQVNWDARPDPFLDEDDDFIMTPDGASVTTGDGDIIPSGDGNFAAETDEAYY